MQPKVSVILTSYNKPKTVGRAIESVLKQTYDNWELFIMDDHSNDQTQQIIKKYLEDPRIQFYDSMVRDEDRYKSTRYATLINEALAKATGDYITYLTDDNLYFPDRLQIMASYLNNHPTHGVVYSQQLIRRMDEKGKTVDEKVRGTKGILTKPQNLVDHCSIMHRASLLPLIYGKYGSYWEDSPEHWHNGDAAFWARLTEWSSFYPIPKTLDICLKTPDSFQELNAFLPKELPPGLLVVSTSGEMFLIDGKKRRKIEKAAFRLFHYNHNRLVKVHDPLLFQYPMGNPITVHSFSNASEFPNFRFLKVEKKYYYTEGGFLRPIETKEAFTRMNADIRDCIFVQSSFIKNFSIGKPISTSYDQKKPMPEGKLFVYKQRFFISDQGIFRPIEKQVFVRLKYNKTDAIPLSKREFLAFPKGSPFNWEVVKWR